MASVINTNIMSLNAQRNLTKSQGGLATAIQRLSSGLRINSSKDDAAGLAISERFTTQIRGLNQAARNANDAISLAQVAEGGLTETQNSLQRIRELAIQSANSTNTASDRAALDLEVQQLVQEVQRIATTSQFNGQNILDGTFSGAQFQVGANANQTINFGISGATTNLLGAFQATSTAVTATGLDGSGLVINGITVGASAATTSAGVTVGSAAAKAAAVNSVSSQTNVSATATTSLTGTAPVAGSGLGNGALLINGIAIGSIAKDASAVTQGQSAATAINAVTSQSGVTATADTSTGALTLTSSEGRDIALTAATATAQGATDIFNAIGLDISAAGNPTGNNTSTIQIGGAFDLSAPAAGSLTEADTVVIDGVTYEFTTDATVAGTNVAVTVADGNTATQVATALNSAINLQFAAGNTTYSSSPSTDTLTLTNAKFGDETLTYDETGVVGGGGAGALVQTIDTATGTDAADGNGVTTRGTLQLSSAENFSFTGSTAGMLTAAGLTTASASLSQLSGVSVDSVANSNSAIAILDGALSQISTIRAGLGALQNRFEAVVSNLTTAAENQEGARSRIRDADFAMETAALTRAQILQQAGIAMISQANAIPQNVLSLLQ